MLVHQPCETSARLERRFGQRARHNNGASCSSHTFCTLLPLSIPFTDEDATQTLEIIFNVFGAARREGMLHVLMIIDPEC